MIEKHTGVVPALEFDSGTPRLREHPPSPLSRFVLYALLALFAILLCWAAFGRLDIIAVAPGRLVPQHSLQIVQPADSGIIKELLVREGDEVKAGQVLLRMDTGVSDADNKILRAELGAKNLQLRRIDAELNNKPLKRLANDGGQMFLHVEAQYQERRRAYLDGLAEVEAQLLKARQDLASALEVLAKLAQTLPHFREQEQVYDELLQDGSIAKLEARGKSRERIEKEQDLRSQDHTVASLEASITQAQKRVEQITSNYRSQLHNERVDAAGQYQKLQQDMAKQKLRHALLELKAPQDGVIKDLSTHTVGAVVSPGTVLMTLVPNNDPLHAEVLVTHLDAGFVRPAQPVKVKLTAYPFQKYGMLEGEVRLISADATEPQGEAKGQASPGYRTIVALRTPFIEREGQRHALSAGMQVSAEINLGSRTVLEYLLSPVQKTVHEAARER
ncbi:MAG: HlyD family type I secretion periplasmic adaptor subunit [Burkholderiales bacterium]|nr:HlyD family type I secretion periplasmic adaptor subunit [Burkholderiales bacterium]